MIRESKTTIVKWTMKIPKLTLGLSLIIQKLGLALISLSLIFLFKYGVSEMEKSQYHVYYTTWGHRVYWVFSISLWRTVQIKHFHNFIRKFFIGEFLAEQKTHEMAHSKLLESKDFYVKSPLELFLLIVDVHLNIGKNWVKMLLTQVTRRTGAPSSSFSSSTFVSFLCSFSPFFSL